MTEQRISEFPYTEPISEYIQGYQIGFVDGQKCGAREFAEWLTCYAFDHIDYVCYGHFINRQGRQISVDEILAEWQINEYEIKQRRNSKINPA